MIAKSIEAKVRPLASPSLEKTSLLGAARVYISKESLLALTRSVDQDRHCVVDKLDQPGLPRRHAVLSLLPDKNVSPNIVMMTRAYQEATGFRIGDQVRISLAEEPLPDAQEVVVVDVTGTAAQDQQPAPEAMYHPFWECPLSLSMDRAGQVFPGMLFEGVNIGKLRRSFQVLSVDTKTTNLAKFQLATTTLRILQPGERDAQSPEAPSAGRGDLVIRGVPGLAAPIDRLNRFLRGFGRPFWIRNERNSCAFVLHGGRGTGKTLILRRIEETRWGKAYWVRQMDKLPTLRETFRQARALQPSIVLVDGLEELLAKDRPNREAVIEALADELDALSDEAVCNGALPHVVVVATCLDYMTDVPVKLQKRSRFRDNAALPIPSAPERLEILHYLDPPLRPEDRERCLASIAAKTHAFNGDDLASLILNAGYILGDRLDGQKAAASQQSPPATTLSSSESPVPQQQCFLLADEMEKALRVTRPTAMHDVNLKPPTIHWQDVGGQESLKRVMKRMIKIAKGTDQAFSRILRNPPKGLLLYGPPGCSKTLSAQAMATESGFNFFAVKGAELLNMYVGESERAVRTLFERARAASPSIIFFDEIDSIGGQRGGGGAASSARAGSGAVNMLTTLLTEMDGFETLTGVLVLAATNRPEAIDPALLRPGRFDQVLYVGPPDQHAREAVFAVHLRGLALASDVDVPELAERAEGHSGAEIKAICNEAGLAVLDRYDEVEGAMRLEITMSDLQAALERAPKNVTEEMIHGYETWQNQFRRMP